MSRSQFAGTLRRAVDNLTDADFEKELAGLLPAEELAGLAIRIRAAAAGLADAIEFSDLG
jgi:hypothetical protein